MIFTNDILTQIAVFILGLCGLWVAWHIYNHKRKQKLLVCPIRFDCNTVVNSDYSKFFGIPVEILGMFYYSLVSLFYLFLILFPGVLPAILISFFVGLSSVAFVFSLYLIGVQIFALRKGCSWCFISAFISTLIFILAVLLY